MCQIYARPLPEASSHTRNLKNGRLDVQVFCLRIKGSGFSENSGVPDSLTFHFLPRNNPMALAINGRLIHSSSSAFITLQRIRTEQESSTGVSYVSSDDIAISDNLCFEIYMGDEVLMFVLLEKNTEIGKGPGPMTSWKMECRNKLQCSSRWKWSLHPVADVVLASRFSGLPLILEQTVELVPRKKRVWHSTLDDIPEGNEETETCCSDCEISDECDFFDDSDCSCSRSDATTDTFEHTMMLYEEPEDAFPILDDSWFLSGLKYGVGIGLGMCIGVGLLVGSSRPLRKRSFLSTFLS